MEASTAIGPKVALKRVVTKAANGLCSIKFPSHNLRETIRAAYVIILNREPDSTGTEHYLKMLSAGKVSLRAFFDELMMSGEAQNRNFITDLYFSLHKSRCMFVRSLPKAERILDLGGSSQDDIRGAIVSMGYPYTFKELIIVDLPAGESHEIYRRNKNLTEFNTESGKVVYKFHSMTQLDQYEPASFDMVFMGQTIEHITPDEADQVCEGVYKILKPGGYFCLDTPNNRGCRLMQPEFINPDHKIEYDNADLLAKLKNAQFKVLETKGLNYMGSSLRKNHFLVDDVARNVGMFAAAEDCFVLAYICQKPR